MPKALARLSTKEIEYFLETGDLSKKLEHLLEDAISTAKQAVDGVATVQFFVEYEEEDGEA